LIKDLVQVLNSDSNTGRFGAGMESKKEERKGEHERRSKRKKFEDDVGTSSKKRFMFSDFSRSGSSTPSFRRPAILQDNIPSKPPTPSSDVPVPNKRLDALQSTGRGDDDDTTSLREMMRQEKIGAGTSDQKNLDAQFAKAIMGDAKFEVTPAFPPRGCLLSLTNWN
jgi:hypothetical protein